MAFAYRAYGLALDSSFSLPGLASGLSPAPGEGVELSLETAAAQHRRWSGPATAGAWRGTLRDGAELTIRWGRAGELLFDYDGGRASFLLDPTAARLGCAPADRGALDWQRVLLTRLLPLIAIARGAEALHAGAVETAAGAVAVLAPSGGGKSTLVAELVGRGQRLLADDVLVLCREPEGVRAHPASFHLSLGTTAGAPGESLGMLGGKHWIAVSGCEPGPRRLAALVLLDRSRGKRPQVRELAASPLPLTPFMLGLPDDEGRAADRFALYSDLVETAPLLELTAAPGDSPASLAAELERAVAAELAGVGR